MELAPSGKLRAGMNLGNALFTTKDPATGELRGVSVDLMRELALRLGVTVDFVVHATPGDVADAVGKGTWDVAILAIALAAASRSVAISTTSAAQTKQRVLAGFVAENLMGELAVRRAWPAPGATEGSQHQAGVEFRWSVEILATPNPDLRRVEIRVTGPENPPHELRRLVGVLAREG